MWVFKIGDVLSRFIVMLLPRRISSRIAENSSNYTVYVLKSKSIKSKPKMTFIEAVFTTILFDLALFGTSNFFINSIIRFFTNFQNSWDKPFKSRDEGIEQITEFCNRLSIQQCPWVWEKRKEEYTSINDFFARTYAKDSFPQLGNASIVSPATCTMTRHMDNASLKSVLIKGCDYRIEDIGLPHEDIALYKMNPILIGYLSPTDYHRCHSPVEGICTSCKLEGIDKYSASVKYFGGKFNLLNENRRLVIVIDTGVAKVALVVVGGIAVDTISCDANMVGKKVSKGQEVSSFRGGGSAIALFSSESIEFTPEFNEAFSNCAHVEVEVGESLANFGK